MRICENGVYRDATPEEIAAWEQEATQQPSPEPTSEERIAALDADMESAACDYEKLNELLKEKEGVQAELDALYEKWEALSLEAGE